MSYSEPPPPPQYGAPQPPYGGGQPAKTSGMAIASLVLGIVGILACGCFIFSILAVVFGRIGQNNIRQSGGAQTGEGLAKWGFILGVVGIVLGIIYWIIVAATGNFEVNTSTS
jgi:hypothetical protein